MSSLTKSNIGSENNAGISDTQYALFDKVFTNSPLATQFHSSYAPISNQNSDLLISPQSERKIDSCVDSLISNYDRTSDANNQFGDHSNQQNYTFKNGVQFPLNRNHYYTKQQHGSELMEDFVVVEKSNSNGWKWLLLIVLLAIIIYAIYVWRKNNNAVLNSNTNIVSDTDNISQAISNLFNRSQ